MLMMRHGKKLQRSDEGGAGDSGEASSGRSTGRRYEAGCSGGCLRGERGLEKSVTAHQGHAVSVQSLPLLLNSTDELNSKEYGYRV